MWKHFSVKTFQIMFFERRAECIIYYPATRFVSSGITRLSSQNDLGDRHALCAEVLDHEDCDSHVV